MLQPRVHTTLRFKTGIETFGDMDVVRFVRFVRYLGGSSGLFLGLCQAVYRFYTTQALLDDVSTPPLALSYIIHTGIVILNQAFTISMRCRFYSLNTFIIIIIVVVINFISPIRLLPPYLPSSSPRSPLPSPPCPEEDAQLSNAVSIIEKPVWHL